MNKKKLLALLMALVMTFSLVPVTAFASSVTADDLPKAVVTNVSADTYAQALSSANRFTVHAYQSEGEETPSFALMSNVTPSMPDRVFVFAPERTAEDIANDGMPGSSYVGQFGEWHCDFAVSFDQPVDADSFILGGYYADANMMVSIISGYDLEKDEQLFLMTDGAGGAFSTLTTYESIVTKIQQFYCTAINLSEENIGKTISVSLVMWEGNDRENAIIVKNTDGTPCTTTLKFEDVEDAKPIFIEGDQVGYYFYPTGMHEGGKVISGTTFVEQTMPGPHFAHADAKAYVAQIGDDGEKFETLAEAIANANPGGTVKLLANVTLDDTVEIAGGKSVTLDLNNYKVSSITNGTLFTVNQAKLALTGTGTIDSSAAPGYGEANGKYYTIQVKGATTDTNGYPYGLSVGSGVTIRSNGYAVQVEHNDNHAYGVQIDLNGTIDAEYGVTVNGTVQDTTGNVPVVNFNGTMSSGILYAAGYAKYNVNGTITGVDSAIEIRAGELNINGGTYTATKSPTNTQGNSSGTTTEGTAIAVAQHKTELPINVNITGGAFNGYVPFYESNPQGNSEDALAKVSIAIRGGTFNANSSSAVYSADKTGFITGGTFNSKPDDKYIAANYEAVNGAQAGWYQVIPAGSAVAKIDDAQYATLQGAINAAGSSATNIVMIANTAEDAVIPEGKNIILDLKGHNTVGEMHAITNNGTLVINDSLDKGCVYTTDLSAQGRAAVLNGETGNLTINGGWFGDKNNDKTDANDVQRGNAVRNWGTATINGGHYTACDNFTPDLSNNQGYAYAIGTGGTNKGGSMTITNADVYGKMNGGVAADSGTLVIKDCNVELTSNRNFYAIWITNDGNVTDVTIEDGYFKGNTNALRASVDDNKQDTSDATIRINGGIFISGNNANYPAVGAFANGSTHTWGASITGGKFSTKPDDSYIADGYEAVKKTENDKDWWYVGKVTTTVPEPAAVTADYDATYTATKTVTDADETTLKEGVSVTVNVKGNSTQDAAATNEPEKAPASLANIKNMQNFVETVTSKTGDASTVNVTVQLDKSAGDVDNVNNKVTYEVHPEAVITTTTGQNEVTTTVKLTNAQIDGTFTFRLNVDDISTTVGNLVKVTHVSEGNEDEVKYYTVEGTSANRYITITTDHFSSWTVEDATSAAVASYVKGGTTYKTDSLAEAFAEAGDGTTITLLSNVALTDRLFINAGTSPAYDSSNKRYATTSENKSITLDMNGHNINTASNIALAGGSLNIVNTGDSVAGGTISTSDSGLAPVEIRGTGVLDSKRTLTIGSGVTLEGSQYGLNVFGSNGEQQNLIDVTVNGTVNGTLFVLGNLKNTQNAINIAVNGKVAGRDYVGIALNGYGNVTVNEGADVSGKSGIEVRAGNLTVTGGTIKGTAAYQDPTPNGSGTTSSGAAVAVAQHGTELPIRVTLTGGTLSTTDTDGKLIVVADPEDKGNIASSVETKSVHVVATESFKNNSAVEDGYEWVAEGDNYTLRKFIDVLGGSLRKRATNGGSGNLVYNETDLRFGFQVTDYDANNGYSYYFTYTVGNNSNSIGPLIANNIDNDGTINLVLTKVPVAYYSSDITATLHVVTSGDVEITASQKLSVKDVASGLKDGNYAETWKNYATEIYALALQQQ